MTLQQARGELKSISAFNSRISERKQRLAELRLSMRSIKTVKYDGFARATANKDGFYLDEAIDRATKLEIKIADDIVTMEETRQRLAERIERLPEPYSAVLTRRYVHLEQFEKIAYNMHYSCERVRHIACEGVKKYAKLYVDTK